MSKWCVKPQTNDERAISLGMGCQYHDNCFTCTLDKCRFSYGRDHKTVKRVIVNTVELEDWLYAN